MKKHLTAGRIIRYLLYFTLVSTLVFSATYARYFQQITGGGSAAIAAVALDVTDSSSNEINLTQQLQGLHPGETKNIVFEITNQKNGVVSQVAQAYSVSVETTGNLPLTYSLAPTDNVSTENYATDPGSRDMTWTGGLLPCTGDITHTYTLTVSWPASENITWYMNEIDAVSLIVNANQALPTAN